MLDRFFFIGVLALLAGNTSFAQTERAKNTGNGYFFVAPGVEGCCGGIMQVGGGGEATIHKGLGVNADLGYMFPIDAAGAGVFTFSAGPTYLFNASRKTVPFITGGGTLAFRSGFGGAYHFGGGVIHWFHPKWGLRFEVRDHIPTRNSDSHLVVFRAGVALR